MTTTKLRQKLKELPGSTFENVDERAWFLQGSAWRDTLWVLKPTNALEEVWPARLQWHFKLPSGAFFTDQRYEHLMESSRQLIALIRSCSLSTGLAQRATTVAGYFVHLKQLLRWMDQAGYTRFQDLDATALIQFHRYIADRKGNRRSQLTPATVQKYLYLLTCLHRFRERLNDGLLIDPFPGRSHGEVAGVRDFEIGRLPYTPENVAIPLVQRAIDLVIRDSGTILEARRVYAQGMASAKVRGLGVDACTTAANRDLQKSELRLTSQPIATVVNLAHSIDMLYAACFVIISYLVGARVSEILHLEAGCVQRRGEGDRTVWVIAGTIFKRQPEYHGRPHEWVAPPAALHAIQVLEALSEGHRTRSGRPQLWQRSTGSAGAREWEVECPRVLKIPSTVRIRYLLNRFGRWLELPLHQGKVWRLSTHQGRKTFARFAALRDRTSLFALAQQLGHRERAVTDQGYSGSDYRLKAEIDAEILEQSTGAWEHMLASSNLGGRAGEEIVAKRPRFKGAKLKQEVKSYARMLVDAGLVLGVCDWGFCVYREEQSACLGGVMGPNTTRREPSTCARCKNFAVSIPHRAYWVGQIDRHHALLNEPSLPLQTLRIVRERMQEALELVAQIDGKATEKKNG